MLFLQSPEDLDTAGTGIFWVARQPSGCNVPVSMSDGGAEGERVGAWLEAVGRATDYLAVAVAAADSAALVRRLSDLLVDGLCSSVRIVLLGEENVGPAVWLRDRDAAIEAAWRTLRQDDRPAADDTIARAATPAIHRYPGRPPDEQAAARREQEDQELLGWRSAMVVPLSAGGRVIGAVEMGWRDGLFGQRELVLARHLAAYAALALQNLDLSNRAREDRARTDRWQMLAAAFSTARTTNDVANVLVTQGCAAYDAPRGLIAVLSSDGATLEIIQMGGFPAETVAAWQFVPMSLSAPLTDAVRDGSPAFYGTPEEVMTRFPHLAGARSPGDAALAALPLTAAEGRTVGAIGLVFDKPRRFSHEERVQTQALAHLCAQAMDRALLYDLAQKERHRAEQANRAKDVLLAMVSHDLRTPLSAIVGWTRLLRSTPMDDERRDRALGTIERNAAAQAQLLGDLLDVSAIVTGTFRLNPGPVELVQLLEAALDTVRPAADAKGVRLLSTFHESRKELVADGARLQQVLWNLLANAVKFTPAGGEVQLRLAVASGTTEIQIRDSGAGIAGHFLPYVFDRFRQAAVEPPAAAQGLGLGLAIAKHLVELHGGTIAVASDGLGRGTTFTVHLPDAAPIDAPAGGGEVPSAGQPTASQVAGPHPAAVSNTGAGREAPAAAAGRHP